MFDSAGNRIAEYNEATGALIREFVWLHGRPIIVIEGGVLTFIRTDHIGRPVFGTNTGGTKVWTASYLPFGGVHTSTGTLPNNRFPGQWFQSESGLHQNWMRDYDPTTGRYLQADPIGLVDGASVYGCVKQNPGRWIDPTGLQTGSGRGGTITFPVPTWPGETRPGQLGGSMIDLINWANQYNPVSLLLQEIVAACTCPACSPYPVGTIGYQGPEIGVKGRDAGTPHYHLFEVQQIPSTCKCI